MSELALKLIEENKKTRSPFLDLGNCGLTEIPVEISELVWLEELSFSSKFWCSDDRGVYTYDTRNSGPRNNINILTVKSPGFLGTYLPIESSYNPFINLNRLRHLFFSYNKDLNDLTPLTILINLQLLSVGYTQVSDLKPLAGLANLRVLFAESAQVIDLKPISGLYNMERLNVCSTEVTNLTPLSGLTNLQQLYLSSTQVTDLTPLSGLVNLKCLDVSNTEVADLRSLIPLIKIGIPVSLGSIAGKYIFVDGCPLTNPPVEIVKQGNGAILNYFQEQSVQGTDRLYEAKMLLIGEGGAGKTTLQRRLFQPNLPLPDENETTKGIEIHQHEFKLDNGRNFRLNVWDFGGQEIYHATHQFFLTRRSLYVLVDDTRKDDKTVNDPNFKYWLEVADLLGEHSPILIFQNEKAGRSKTIDESGIKAKFPNVQEVCKGNLEFSGSAEALRKAVEYHVQKLPHIGEELPTLWIDIRADIEQAATTKPFISQQAYFDIYSKHLDFDKAKALHLSRYLHELGVFLHFQDEDLLKRTVILQNTWATEAVYKMLDDETVKAKLGRFDKIDCDRVWQDSAYADMHPELLALMQKFELCYKLPDVNVDRWLAPQLLPPSKPVGLADWAKPDDLTLRYRYDFLPKGIVSRLIVRMHRLVQQPDLSWVNGALFEREGSELLAEVPTKGGEIILRARGSERKELLSVISADLDALNDSFHGLKNLVAKWVPCYCKLCSQTTEPEYFEQKRLLQRKKDGKLKVECSASYENVDVLALLDGSNSKILPKVKRVFISYSKHDVHHKDNLLKHLTGLRDRIITWNDRDILPGDDWDERIKDELGKANVVLYLVTTNSMATDYIQNIELPMVEQRCRNQECILIPVIVDFCLWEELDFAKYNALPDKGKPITDKTWATENEAWLKVVQGIKRTIET